MLLSGNLAGMGNWLVSHTMNVYHSSGGKAEHADKFGNTVHFEKTTAMISLPQMSQKTNIFLYDSFIVFIVLDA